MSSWKKILINISGIIMVGILILLINFHILLPLFTKHNRTLVMPNILGLNMYEAKTILKDTDLNYKILENDIYTLTYPAETIIEQNPIANSIIKHGRTVYLKFNPSHPPFIKVPNLIDKSIRNVYSIIKSIGLKRGEITYVPDMAENVIISAYCNSVPLEENITLPLGSTIDLVVGVNHLETLVPNLYGLKESEVELKLLENKLQVGTIKYIELDTADPGTVVNQNIISEYVPCGTPICIDIIKAVEKVEMSDTNETLMEDEIILEENDKVENNTTDNSQVGNIEENKGKEFLIE